MSINQSWVRSPDTLGVVMYLVAAFLFAFNGSIAKLAMAAGLDAMRLTELRNAGAMAVLVLFVLATNRGAFRIKRGEFRFLLAYGVIAFVLVQFLYFFTISRLPLGIGTLLAFLAPVVVALWAKLGQRSAVSNRLWIAIALTLVGLALVAQVWNGLRLDLIGVVAGVGTAMALAVYWLLGEAGQRHRDGVSLSMWGFIFATGAWTVLAPWWSFPWDVLMLPTDSPMVGFPPVPVWSIMLWGVLLGTVAIVNVNTVPPVAGFGRATLLLWVVAFAAFFIPEAIAVMALSRRYPGEGGVYLWARRHFGDLHGFVSGWCYWTNNLFYVPVLLVYLAGVVAFAGGASTAGLVDDKWFVATIAFGWLAIITVANVRGMGVGKWINNINI